MCISIHAPLAGCDYSAWLQAADGRYFNPRTPCGVRHARYGDASYNGGFQSTHPLRGATLGLIRFCRRNPGFQSTHPLRGATALIRSGACTGRFQSTHPLRGATSHGDWRRNLCGYFNPRTPCGVRHNVWEPGAYGWEISIHAPLAGCDARSSTVSARPSYFNPRTPCGVRHTRRIVTSMADYFNPRTPCGVRQQKRTKKTALF